MIKVFAYLLLALVVASLPCQTAAAEEQTRDPPPPAGESTSQGDPPVKAPENEQPKPTDAVPGEKDTPPSTASGTPNGTTGKGSGGESVRVSDKIAIPYPRKEWVEYMWILDGEPAGTHATWLEDLPEEGRILVRGRLNFEGPGRKLIQEGETTLGPTLEPVRYKRERRVLVETQGIGTQSVKSEFSPGIAATEWVDGKGTVVDHEFELPSPCYIYDAQAFEHWVLFAPIVHHFGSGIYNLYNPGENRIFTFKVTKVREEDVDGVRVVRWDFEHFQMKGSIWITPDGSLDKYQQGTLEVLRARK